MKICTTHAIKLAGVLTAITIVVYLFTIFLVWIEWIGKQTQDEIIKYPLYGSAGIMGIISLFCLGAYVKGQECASDLEIQKERSRRATLQSLQRAAATTVKSALDASQNEYSGPSVRHKISSALRK